VFTLLNLENFNFRSVRNEKNVFTPGPTA
jgi:hypothetical protein